MKLTRRRALSLLAAAVPALRMPPATAQVLVKEPALAIPRLSISPAVAAKVGRQVWHNESGGRPEGVTAWNDAEDFPSLGIGHFIWFKAGGHPQFEESFPKLVGFMRTLGARPPAWLDKQPFPPCPWQSKAEFYREFQSPKMLELRGFLLDSVPQQTQYLLVRTEAAIPKMLAALAKPEDRAHVSRQVNRVVRSSPDLYPLIDYVNFKGEGISDKETVFDNQTRRKEGWGMRWLLLEMQGTEMGPPALAEFSRAAKAVLDRRIRNHPTSARWRIGWHKRCDTYRMPLV